MKVLVLGCNGMAGHMISTYFNESGHDVTGFARIDKKHFKTIVGNVKDVKLLSSTILNEYYDAVINCVGILNEFAENDKEMAVFVNSYLPHLLSKITKELDTKVVHMSTDCVFSGKRGKYTEDDFRDGITFYSRTKAMGELNDYKNVTFRTSIIGPDIKKEGIGLLNWFLKQENEVNGYSKVIWTGITTLQLAKVIEAAIEQKAYGIINVVPDIVISKYDLLKLFNKYFRNNMLSVIKDDTVISNKSLVRTKYNNLDYIIPDYEQMVFELSQWVNIHSYLYPQYNL